MFVMFVGLLLGVVVLVMCCLLVFRFVVCMTYRLLCWFVYFVCCLFSGYYNSVAYNLFFVLMLVIILVMSVGWFGDGGCFVGVLVFMILMWVLI